MAGLHGNFFPTTFCLLDCGCNDGLEVAKHIIHVDVSFVNFLHPSELLQQSCEIAWRAAPSTWQADSSLQFLKDCADCLDWKALFCLDGQDWKLKVQFLFQRGLHCAWERDAVGDMSQSKGRKVTGATCCGLWMHKLPGAPILVMLVKLCQGFWDLLLVLV